ncbi:unnamed protein product [Spirodela intermedia]|uniref:Uncharacterized protein n=1 Tax=Spirodela intermedia TaxID=51605 RepID=A0A7I8IQ80_SPIIN|nr:unnamed protein product [Spirodela intermedia]CAA6660128.1 unnamed protein product [Spirodela intermedia]
MLGRGPKLLRRLICLSGGGAAGASELSGSWYSWAEALAKKPFTTRTSFEPKQSRNTFPGVSSIRGRRSNRQHIPPPPHRRRDPFELTPPADGLPEVESICYLLSDPSNRRKAVEDLLSDHGDELSSELVLGVLTNYRKLGRVRTLDFFSWAGSRLSYRFDDVVVEYMADFLGRRKLFDDLKSRPGRSRSASGSWEAGESGRCPVPVRDHGIGTQLRPDNIVFNNVLYMLCKLTHTEDSIDVALAFFRRIGCPDEYSYSNVLLGLCKSGRMVSALKVFDEMLMAKLLPTRTAANVLIGALCNLGLKKAEKVPVRSVRRPFDVVVPHRGVDRAVESVLEVFWALWKQGLLPSAFVVDRLISELHRLGRIEEAVGVLKAAASKKPRSFEESYFTTIRALCRARRLDGAGELLETMLSQGLKPKASVYTSIISALCKLGDLDEAHKYLEVMNKMRCEPDSGTYTALVHANCGIRSWEPAYELLMEMIGLGLSPHLATQKLVDNLLIENGRSDLSAKLAARIEFLLLQRHCRAGDLEAAYDKLARCSERASTPHRTCYRD